MFVAATGHRPNKLGGYDFFNPQRVWIRNRIWEELTKLKPTACISGMALGIDQDFAWTAMWMGIPVLAAVPFAGQESQWPASSQEFYKELLVRCYHIEVVCQGGYAAWKMQKRNEWMVDHCQVLLAVWDGSSGGTGNCVGYANRVGRQMVRIDPREAPT
jgi:uncharacterized phage-like protein YoqJ